MKAKVTKLAVKNSFTTILSLGYCQLQYLLYYKKPYAYSCGSYGWSCDYYDIENICISTGYSPIGSDVDYKLVKLYEARAEKIVENYNIKYEARVKKVNKLIIEFLNKCTQ